MAIFLLHAARDEASAEALARACERRGLFVEVETGRRAGRAFKADDHCIAMLSLAEAQDPLAAARRRRAFDACTQAKLSLLPLEEGLSIPFGWRDLQRLAPPELGGAWGGLAASLQEAPAHNAAGLDEDQTFGQPLHLLRRQQQGIARRRVALVSCKSTLIEAENLREALAVRAMRGWTAPADAPGPQISRLLGDMDMAVVLLSAESGASDGVRRWLYGAHRMGMPVLGVMVDSLWRDSVLADHLGKIPILPLHRLPGDRRGGQLAARCRALPRRRKSRERG